MLMTSKYNTGDIVQFVKDNGNIGVGRICSVRMTHSYETQKRVEYEIYLLRVKPSCVYNSLTVKEYNIQKKLNKKAFEKAYAQECAKYLSSEETNY